MAIPAPKIKYFIIEKSNLQKKANTAKIKVGMQVRIAAKFHPLTIEQNAITSFKSRTTLVPCRANTIGPALFLQADYAIGGADGEFNRGMGWQGMSFLTTLHYGSDMNITSTFIPTLPGKLFYLKNLAGPLVPECN